MSDRGWVAGVVAASFLLLAAAPSYRLADKRRDDTAQPGPFRKVLVIGITDDIQARKVFENKFVSHLRGQRIDGVTSYSIVPDLAVVEDEERIVREIRARNADGAISVRLVPLKSIGEAEWIAAWEREVAEDGDLRELIEASLPVAEVKTRSYGVEVALWETQDWHRVWAARTGTFTRKQVRKGAGSFVQTVMRELKNAGLFPLRPEAAP